MTLEEAAERIGQKVIYRATHSPAGEGRPQLDPYPHEIGHGPAEEGVITSVGKAYVFVRYGADTGSKATHPAMLEAVAR